MEEVYYHFVQCIQTFPLRDVEVMRVPRNRGKNGFVE
jgi:hypothetical protein